MQVRHKRHGRISKKGWGNEVIIISSRENNYTGKILNFNQNTKTSTHFHSIKNKTLYVLSGSITIGVIDPVDTTQYTYTVDTDEAFDIEPNVTHYLEAKNGPATILELSTYHEDKDVYRVASGNK